MPNCAKIPILHTIFILPKLLTTSEIQFCHYTTNNSFIFYLTYTTHINLILCLNLNYEKMLNCVYTINYLPMNSNKKIQECPNTFNSFISDLAYSACTNPILRSN